MPRFLYPLPSPMSAAQEQVIAQLPALVPGAREWSTPRGRGIAVAPHGAWLVEGYLRACGAFVTVVPKDGAERAWSWGVDDAKARMRADLEPVADRAIERLRARAETLRLLRLPRLTDCVLLASFVRSSCHRLVS